MKSKVLKEWLFDVLEQRNFYRKMLVEHNIIKPYDGYTEIKKQSEFNLK